MKLNPTARVHYLKTWPNFHQDVRKLKKRFDIRFNDRDFQVGDILILQEFDPKTCEYTHSPDITALVTYVLSGPPFLPPDYVCMSINVLQ